eukprot:2326740-Lingulodinium_polyedra.AAC.1
MNTHMLRELMPDEYSSTLGNLLRALPMAVKQPSRKARKVCPILPIQSKSGIDQTLMEIGGSALDA